MLYRSASAVLSILLWASTAAAQQQAVLFPYAGAEDVCPDTPLKLTTEGPISLGNGKIEVRDAASKAVVATINLAEATRVQAIGGLTNYTVRQVITETRAKPGGAALLETAIYLPPRSLVYGKSYEVVLSPAIAGVNAEGWRFSTKAAPPAGDSARVVVAANGTGDFATIQGAIDFVPEGNKLARTILIEQGTYNEILCLMDKSHITFLGQAREGTVIAYANNERFNVNAGGNPFGPGAPLPGLADPKTQAVYRRGVFLMHRASDITIANLTIRNTTAKGGGQAETIIFNGSADAGRVILTNLNLHSFQDTVQFNGQTYINECYVEGDTDFIWGTGPCFFQNVHARAVTSGAIFTTVRCPPPPNTNHGFVFKDCTLDGAAGVMNCVLARIEANRFPTSETILLNTMMSAAIPPAGWRAPTGGDASQIHFWEYSTHDADGKPVDTSRRTAPGRTLQADADKELIASYSDPRFVLGGKWTPALAPLIARSPTDVTTKVGGSIQIGVDAIGIPAVTYQWQKDGKDIPGATKATLRLENLKASDAATYTVEVSNSTGKAISSPAKLVLSN